jgi:hypothetical protein
MKARYIAAAVVLASLAGCATESEPEYGSSVRHMITGQVYDPSAPKDTVGAMDGEKAGRAVDAYHAEKKSAQKGNATPSAILMPTSQ